jgi:hypothetical protein
MQQLCSAIFDFETTSRTMIFVQNLYDVESNVSEVHAQLCGNGGAAVSYKDRTKTIICSVVSILIATLDSICAARHPCLLIFG